MSVKTLQQFKAWKPIKSSVLKEEKLAEHIHEIGYKVLPFLRKDDLVLLKELFKEEHEFNIEDGGMFYSLYSKDKEYRKRIHEKIQAILLPSLEAHLADYQNVVNFFIVKLPGEKSEFYVHQDATGLDEFQFSPLSLWIPLDDITPQNGALTLIEKTHWFFSPFRGVSIDFPFKGISNSIKKYLNPIYMKAGEALFFDNRIIHNSMANTSKEARIAIVCGIFPKEARFQSCYQDKSAGNKSIEIFEHQKNYLLDYPHFFYNCTDRPQSGKIIKRVDKSFPEMSEKEFETLCTINNIPIRNQISSADSTTVNCQMIAEPDGINRFEDEPSRKSWIDRILRK